MEAAPVGMIMIDENGIIVTTNHETTQLFGYGKNELIGQFVEILIPQDKKSEHHNIRAAFMSSPQKRRMQQGLDTFGLRKNGEIFPVDVGLNPIATNEGFRVVASIIDISERVKSQEYIERYMQDLERSNQELDNFAYIASHDLRSPLRGLNHLTQWIEEDLGEKSDPTIQKHLNMMHGRIKRMDKLLTDLLVFSRVNADAIKLEKRNARDLITTCFEMISTEKEAHLLFSQKDYPEIDSACPPLEQILRNLLSNSIKHCVAHKVTIDVTLECTDTGYIFTISDNGPGINPEFHEKIFKMFQTLRPRDEVEGSGMGLALIRKILTYYNETIEVESDGQSGSHFRFSWPNAETFEKVVQDKYPKTLN